MPKKPVYQKRTFLNDNKTMSAFVIATVEKLTVESQRNNKEKKFPSLYPQFDISDCSEKISLDFSFFGETEMKTVRKKIRLFRQIVNEFADALEGEMDTYNGSTTEQNNSKTGRKARNN